MNFQDSQQQWAAHLRNPIKNPPPQNIEPRRIKIYQDLLYNNVENFLANGFPVLRKITPEDQWHQLVRDFFEQHSCNSPYFADIGYEFLIYITEERPTQQNDFPFLHELAHYEWVELALETAQDEITTDNINPQGDLLTENPVLSPLAWLLQYSFPVHQISPENIPKEAATEAIFLVVYRNPEYNVGFMEINAFTARLLTFLQENPAYTGQQAIEQLIEEVQHPNPSIVIEGGRETLEHLRNKTIILGSVAAHAE